MTDETWSTFEISKSVTHSEIWQEYLIKTLQHNYIDLEIILFAFSIDKIKNSKTKSI